MQSVDPAAQPAFSSGRSWLSRDRVVAWSLVFGSAYVCYFSLLYIGTQASWYPLGAAMDFTIDPPFRHRILFVVLANAIHSVFPTFSDVRVYFLAQLPVVVATFIVIRPWARRFVPGPWANLAPPLLAFMLIPSFAYWTFYDIGIVFFFTLAPILLVSRRRLAYTVVLAIGTLNHEITLLLIPLSIAIAWRDPALRRGLWLWVLIQLAVYAGVRALLFTMVPVDAVHAGFKVEWNLLLPFRSPSAFLMMAIAVGSWLVPAYFGLRHAPSVLRRCVVLLPLLLLEILVLGQFNEVRHFDPFMPIAVPLVLLAVRGDGMSKVDDVHPDEVR